MTENTGTTTAPEPIALRTPHDIGIVRQALDARASDLEKLSKKNEDTGYSREAKAIDADVAAIRYHILPAFSRQFELPLVTADKLEERITGALRGPVHKALLPLTTPGTDGDEDAQADAFKKREDRVLEDLAGRITRFVLAATEEAYNAGVAARENVPAALAVRSVNELGTSD